MASRDKTKRFLSKAASTAMSTSLSLILSLMTALPAHAQTAALDLNAERYNISFQPVGNRRIIFRDEEGNFLGYSAEGADLELQVTGDVIRSAIVNGAPDVNKILDSLSSVHGSDGKSYMRMALPYEITTAEGHKLEPGKRILLDMRYFYNQTVQPAGATGANAAADDLVADKFNDQVIEQAQGEPLVETADDGAPVPLTQDSNDAAEDDGEEGEPVLSDDGMQSLRGNPFPTKFLSAPTCNCPAGCHFTSRFGKRKSEKTLNGRMSSPNHKGLDIGGRGQIGAGVVAAADGIVRRRQNVKGYGATVFIDHGNGYETQYSHLASIDPNIRIGTHIKRGQRVGTMGKSGNSTAPHLHFGLFKNRIPINPWPMLLSHSDADTNRTCTYRSTRPDIDEAMSSALNAGSSRSGSNRRVQRTTSVQ